LLPDLNFEVTRLTTQRLDIYREMGGAFVPRKAFGDSVALTFESEARGRSPYPMPSKGSCGPRLRFCAFGGVENRHSRERHYGFACSSFKPQLELDLRYT
jgi:hypothetical protein